LFLVLILIYKIGIAPFQNWYFNILNSISWQAIWILTVWLKVLYLKILTLINSIVLNFIVILNVTVACISLFKEKILKTLIGISSLFNIAWLLIRLKLNNVWVIYLALYSFNLAILIRFFKESHLTTITPTNLKFKSNLKEISIAIILFMAGIPPFSGFLLKLLILSNLTNFSFITRTFLLISSIIFMYFYIIIYFYLTTQSRPKINLYNNNKFLWMKITTINFLVAPVTLFLITYYLNNKYKKILIK